MIFYYFFFFPGQSFWKDALKISSFNILLKKKVFNITSVELKRFIVLFAFTTGLNTFGIHAVTCKMLIANYFEISCKHDLPHHFCMFPGFLPLH